MHDSEPRALVRLLLLLVSLIPDYYSLIFMFELSWAFSAYWDYLLNFLVQHLCSSRKRSQEL